MAYSVEDITEFVRYHLGAAAPNDEVVDRNLMHLTRSVEAMLATPVSHEPIQWMVCEECGASVATELTGPDGAGELADGGFYCVSCRVGEYGSSIDFTERPAGGRGLRIGL
jgi:hypothetical protein